MKLSSRVGLGISLLGVQSALAQAPLPTDSEPSGATSVTAKDGAETDEREGDVAQGPRPAAESSPPPRALEVDDPMLEPVPPPERVVQSWQEALRMVRHQSTDYLQSQAQVEAARGRSRMALAGALPTLTANARYNYHLLTSEVERGTNPVTGEPIVRTIPDPRDALNYGATLRIPILSVRNWYDYATSRRVIEQNELNRDDAERMIIGGLAELMVNVVTAERLAEVTRVNLAAALSTLDLNRRRARLGAGNAVDVLRSEQEVARSRADLVRQDEALRQAREALGDALGLAEAVGLPPDIKMDRLRKDARDTCTANEDPLDRADVRAAAAGAAIAERNVTSTWLDHLPTLDFVSTLSHTSNASLAFVQTTWTIGGALTWRLYDGGLRYGERRLNRALLTQAEETARQAERRARIEAVQATRAVRVAEASLKIAKESRKIAKNNAKLARAKFINGSGTSFDMVDTQSTARQTELDVTVKEFELLRAEIVAFLALASCDL